MSEHPKPPVGSTSGAYRSSDGVVTLNLKHILAGGTIASMIGGVVVFLGSFFGAQGADKVLEEVTRKAVENHVRDSRGHEGVYVLDARAARLEERFASLDALLRELRTDLREVKTDVKSMRSAK